MRKLALAVLLIATTVGVAQYGLRSPAFVGGVLRPASAGVDPDLEGWWKLNDGSGTSAADATGNGNTGTITGNPTWGTGPNSNGDLVFDGTGDLVTIANEANFDFETNTLFSITFWLKVNSSASGVDLLYSKNSAIGNLPGYTVQADPDNQQVKAALVDIVGAAATTSSGINSVVLNTWYFIAVTYDGSSTGAGLKIYVNAGTPATGSGSVGTSILNNADPVFGVKAGLGGDLWAELDDARIYTKQLTSGEVSTLNSAGAQ